MQQHVSATTRVMIVMEMSPWTTVCHVLLKTKRHVELLFPNFVFPISAENQQVGFGPWDWESVVPSQLCWYSYCAANSLLSYRKKELMLVLFCLPSHSSWQLKNIMLARRCLLQWAHVRMNRTVGVRSNMEVPYAFCYPKCALERDFSFFVCVLSLTWKFFSKVILLVISISHNFPPKKACLFNTSELYDTIWSLYASDWIFCILPIYVLCVIMMFLFTL